MTCVKCEKLTEEMNLTKGTYKKTTFDQWFDARKKHGDLACYADFNNGVSEGGNGYICGQCATFFETNYSIFMEENQLEIQLLEDVRMEDIQEAAHMLLLKKKAVQIQEQIDSKPRHQVYVKSNVFVPHVFHYGTEQETELFPLDIHYQFGLNDEEISDYTTCHLTFDEALGDMGTNDQYVEKTVFLTCEVAKEDLHVKTVPSSYGPACIHITITNQIKPNELFVYNMENGTTTPLSQYDLSTVFNRDHTVYLKKVRTLQNQLPQEQNEVFQQEMDQKLKEINEKYQL